MNNKVAIVYGAGGAIAQGFALAIVGLGILIVLAPSSVLGITPPM